MDSKLFVFCNDFISSVPNVLIRSCLFSCKRLGHDREFMSDVEVHSQSNYSVRFTGYEMNEFDGQVYNALTRMMKKANVKPGDTLWLHRADLCRETGKSPNGGNLDTVWRSVKRLKHATVDIISFDSKKKVRMRFLGSLVSSCGYDDSGSNFVILDPVISKLYESDTTTIDYAKRQELNSMLARRLFDFISSNSTYIPLGLESLKSILGYPLSVPEFKRQVSTSLEAIIDVAPNLLQSFEFDDARGTVKIIRTGAKGVRKVTAEMTEAERLDAVIARLDSMKES